MDDISLGDCELFDGGEDSLRIDGPASSKAATKDAERVLEEAIKNGKLAELEAKYGSTDNDDDDEDWDHIEHEELFDNDGQPHDGVIYQDPSFQAAWKEYVDRVTPSAEKQRTMKAAWEILKFGGQFGYALVSEPLLDAADWVVRQQFGTDLEGLPAELRVRLMRKLPSPAAATIRVANRYVFL